MDTGTDLDIRAGQRGVVDGCRVFGRHPLAMIGKDSDMIKASLGNDTVTESVIWSAEAPPALSATPAAMARQVHLILLSK